MIITGFAKYNTDRQPSILFYRLCLIRPLFNRLFVFDFQIKSNNFFKVILTVLHTKVVAGVLNSFLNPLKLCRYGSYSTAGRLLISTIKSVLERICARASILTCALVCTCDCSFLLGIARAIQDLCIRNTEFFAAEACQMFCLG